MYTEAVVTGLIAMATSGIGYLFGKRNQIAEAQSTELDAVGKAITIWRNLATELKKEVDDLRVEVKELHDELEKMRAENESLERSNSDLLYQVNQLKIAMGK